MESFEALKQELSLYLEPSALAEVEAAFLFSKVAHEGQIRVSGEPYVTHPIAVARLLADMRLDKESIIAALLHDVIEDTGTSKETIQEKFGSQVAELVDGVSKLAQIKFDNRAEAQAENFRKMVLAMVKDIRVILVKLADRLHNMRTLGSLSRKRQQRKARETIDIYAPIANRLGMHNFRIELEELCFQALYPMRYRVLKEVVRNARGNRKEILSDIHQAVEQRIAKLGISVEGIWGREKHLYGIYKKMRSKHLQFSEVLDVYAFRIIVASVDDCYRVMGAVHNLYKPVPERFKDYIAIPKANGYQSLHTTLFGPYGVPIEVQIRTREMDETASSGIAAYWLYKSDEERTEPEHNEAQRRIRAWVQGLLDMQKGAGSSLEFIENVKVELFPDEVYVFTPKGMILELPSGATAVDFAYAVHSDIGDMCVAAKIDRRLAPLSTQLMNGQTVEIITAPGTRPNPAWLNFVVTGKARSNLRHFIKIQKQRESISLGQELLQNALETLGVADLETLAETQKQAVLQAYQLSAWDALLENIGFGNHVAIIVARQLLGMTEELPAFDEAERASAAHPVSIKGGTGMLIEFADCCRPIPGDPIVGELRPGQGLLVHHEHCRNVLKGQQNHRGNYIAVCWEEGVVGDFRVDLRAEVYNRRGVLADIAVAIADAEANINDIKVFEFDSYSHIDITLSVRDRIHLARVLKRLRRHSLVIKLSRQRDL